MPVASLDQQDALITARGLSSSRTIDRQLVHRDSLAEIFLTGIAGVTEASYAAAAMLPRSHAYYGDHPDAPQLFDPILLLEVCRQAGLAAAHALFGIPNDWKFILTHQTIEITDCRALAVGPAACRVDIVATVTGKRVSGGQVTGVDSVMVVHAAGQPLASATIGLRFKSPASYLSLRMRNRSGAALPSTAQLALAGAGPGLPAPDLAGPVTALVGRADPRNVIVDPLPSSPGAARTALRIPAAHPSLFDHPQDHLPGMVLTEAARQTAMIAARGARARRLLLPAAVRATYAQFGELEPQTVLEASPAGPPGAGPSWQQVRILQNETLISDVSFLLTEVTA